MIVFISRTGNIRHIVGKLDKSIPTIELTEDLLMNEPYLLFTYTDGLGEVPEKVWGFLNNGENAKYLKGVISSGNTNFGKNVFCGSADKISEHFNVPVIRKIELRGFDNDVKVIEDKYNTIIIEGENG